MVQPARLPASSKRDLSVAVIATYTDALQKNNFKKAQDILDALARRLQDLGLQGVLEGTIDEQFIFLLRNMDVIPLSKVISSGWDPNPKGDRPDTSRSQDRDYWSYWLQAIPVRQEPAIVSWDKVIEFAKYIFGSVPKLPPFTLSREGDVKCV